MTWQFWLGIVFLVIGIGMIVLEKTIGHRRWNPEPFLFGGISILLGVVGIISGLL